jgi:hypothetical protein
LIEERGQANNLPKGRVQEKHMSAYKKRGRVDEIGFWGSKERNGLLLPKITHRTRYKLLWWYHGLAKGWPSTKVPEHADLMVGWKGDHPQSVGGK